MKLLLLLAVLGLLLYLFFYEPSKKGTHKKTSHSSSSSQDPKPLVKDPVCNVYLPEDEAIKYRWRGEIYYFCSEDCKKRFIDERKRSSH